MQRQRHKLSNSMCQVIWFQLGYCFHRRWVLSSSVPPLKGNSLPDDSVNEGEQCSQMWDMLPTESRGTYHTSWYGMQ